MKPARNLLAGLANSIWSALISLAVIPFYLEYLGVEAYGLIGFFATMQALLQLLDMGLAPTINREVAQLSATGDLRRAGRLLHTLAFVYWGMAAVIALLIAALAPLIAGYWLQSRHLSQQTIEHALMLMGLVIAYRWPIGLYQGALIGAQRLTVSSGISISMVTLGNLGAVAVLAFISPTIEAFFLWQAGAGLLYTVVMRFGAWKVIGRARGDRFDATEFKRVVKFSAGVGAITLCGLLLMQLDKVILSKTVALADFGHYMLATMLASSLYLLVTPMFNVAFPRLSSLVARANMDGLLEYYRKLSRLLAAILFPSAMVLVLLAEDLVRLWTGHATIAVNVAPLLSLLMPAYALHGIMYAPYALMLAHGETKLAYSIYIPLIVVMVPLTIALSLKYGAMGGATAQFIQFALYALIGTWLTHKRFLSGWSGKWVSQDVGVPLGISILVGAAGYLLLQTLVHALYLKLLLGMILWMIAAHLSIFSSRLMRQVYLRYWCHIYYSVTQAWRA